MMKFTRNKVPDQSRRVV